MAPTSPAVGRADAPRGRKAVGGVAPTYAFFGRCQPCTVTWRARATVSSPAGASLPITEPAPMVAPLPIVTGAPNAAVAPMKALSSLVVVDLFPPSSLPVLVSAPAVTPAPLSRPRRSGTG